MKSGKIAVLTLGFLRMPLNIALAFAGVFTSKFTH